MDGDLTPVEVEPARYRAFISYSHSDSKVADWLHHALETYPIPAKLVGTETRVGVVPRRLQPIFRDRDELSASHDLGGELRAALRSSKFLLVICSPASARSRWVEEEVRSFKRLHGEHHILAVIASGEPNASEIPGREAEECFPLSLRFLLDADGELTREPAHPIAADIREGKDGRHLGKLKLVAGLTGVRLDDVVQREAQRRVRRLTRIATAAVLGMAVTGGLAIYANVQRVEAVRERRIADRETAAARASSDFLIGTFRLTNPAKENPRTVTALSILQNGAAKVGSDLAAQPEIQARLLRTLGNAFNNLGVPAETEKLLEQSMPNLRRAGAQGAAALDQLAFAYVAQARLSEAMKTVEEAERQLGPDQRTEPEIRARLENARAKILFAEVKPREGLAAIDRALAFFARAPNAPAKSVAVALQIRGMALTDNGEFDAADASLRQSVDLMRKTAGDSDMATAKAWQAVAINDVAAKHLAAADAHIRQTLSIDNHVLSDDNPQLAADLTQEGRIFQAEHKTAAAIAALTRAVGIYERAYGKPQYQTGMARVYLALAQADAGQTHEALTELDKAKHDYDIGYGRLNPNHGDLLVNRATILARAGRRQEAIVDCADGVAILAQTLGPDAAFTKANRKICTAL